MGKTKNPVLRQVVLEYVRQNDGKIDLVDIATHCRLRMDITLAEVAGLVDENKIRRVRYGMNYVYEIV